jgi:hypothetical protein
MNREKTFLVTRQTLLSDFGTLDDLPPELANTIANVYYRYWSIAEMPDRQFTSIDDSIASIEELNRIQVEFEFSKKIVAEMRRLKPQVHQTLFAVTSDMFVSILKYKIDDAVTKSPVRLKFERFLRRNKVNEMPGLIDALQLHKG